MRVVRSEGGPPGSSQNPETKRTRPEISASLFTAPRDETTLRPSTQHVQPGGSKPHFRLPTGIPLDSPLSLRSVPLSFPSSNRCHFPLTPIVARLDTIRILGRFPSFLRAIARSGPSPSLLDTPVFPFLSCDPSFSRPAVHQQTSQCAVVRPSIPRCLFLISFHPSRPRTWAPHTPTLAYSGPSDLGPHSASLIELTHADPTRDLMFHPCPRYNRTRREAFSVRLLVASPYDFRIVLSDRSV
jgi:hypothetical protein